MKTNATAKVERGSRRAFVSPFLCALCVLCGKNPAFGFGAGFALHQLPVGTAPSGVLCSNQLACLPVNNGGTGNATAIPTQYGVLIDSSAANVAFYGQWGTNLQYESLEYVVATVKNYDGTISDHIMIGVDARNLDANTWAFSAPEQQAATQYKGWRTNSAAEQATHPALSPSPALGQFSDVQITVTSPSNSLVTSSWLLNWDGSRGTQMLNADYFTPDATLSNGWLEAHTFGCTGLVPYAKETDSSGNIIFQGMPWVNVGKGPSPISALVTNTAGYYSLSPVADSTYNGPNNYVLPMSPVFFADGVATWNMRLNTGGRSIGITRIGAGNKIDGFYWDKTNGKIYHATYTYGAANALQPESVNFTGSFNTDYSCVLDARGTNYTFTVATASITGAQTNAAGFIGGHAFQGVGTIWNLAVK